MFDRYRYADEEPENTQPFVFSTLQRLYREHRLTDMVISYDGDARAVGKLAGRVSLRLAGGSQEGIVVVNKYGPLYADGRYDVIIGYFNPYNRRDEKSTNYYDTANPNARIGANPCDDMELVELLDTMTVSRDLAAYQSSATDTIGLTPCYLLDGPGENAVYNQTLGEIRQR